MMSQLKLFSECVINLAVLAFHDIDARERPHPQPSDEKINMARTSLISFNARFRWFSTVFLLMSSFLAISALDSPRSLLSM